MKNFSPFALGCLGILVLIGLLLTGAGVLSLCLMKDEAHDLAGKNPRLGLVRIEDAIFDSDAIVAQIKKMEKAKSIKGLLLRLNTPGGGIAASQEIYQAVIDFRKTQRPVYVSMGTLAASGGYYVACAADSIYANPGTITGSIGVIMEFPQAEKLLEKIGLQLEIIKSGKLKDAGSFHRPMNTDEKQYFTSLIMDAYSQFLDAIVAHRPLTLDQLRPIADGRIFTGRQAMEYKLVDGLLSYEQTVVKLRLDCHLPEDAEVVEISKKEEWWKKMVSSAADGALPFGLFPRVAYLLLNPPLAR